MKFTVISRLDLYELFELILKTVVHSVRMLSDPIGAPAEAYLRLQQFGL